ncbi:M20/M25/M40 family metallo-hydrolase [Sphingomonas bacterium]|uniref:M20/M25/M40 family metallo-hydrolase n=1 Tax=Sphingomonas bacterium TaxID=1895847 RepID=UPI00262CB59F|nr:M20/M25/M40 family metallo-hydrolase [Sphingomonas bacterium]MDB5679129.1 peptidase [Sphingomonas bacterium]
MRNWWALLTALVGAIVLAIVATTPPGPAGNDAPSTAFSATRAMADVRVIGRAPHPTGSAEDAVVRAHLIARLQAMGLEVATATGAMDADGAKRLAGWSKSTVTPPLTNIVAILPGRDRAAPAVLLMAHHDSVWGSPGAADDGAGVASILETVRAIRASGQVPQRDLMILLTDGEELGLEGAKSFFANDPRRGHVGVIVNLETRGGGGRASMFETGSDNGAMMDLFAGAVGRPVGTSLSVFIYKKLPNSTDYTVAKKLGVPGFNFAFIGRPELYHSPLATPERLDQGALQDMGRQVLDLTRGLLAAPALPGKAADRVFFDAFGLFFVSYAPAIGWLILLLGAGGYAVAAWRRSTVAEVAKGAGVLLALIVAAGLALYLVNLASGAGGKTNYYDRLAAIPRLEVQALLVCLALLVTLRRWLPSKAGTIAGAAVPLLALGAFAQIAAPTAAYPFAVPLMLGGLALALDRLAGRSAGAAAAIFAAVLGVGYMLGFGFFLLQAVGPGMPMIAAVPLAIATVLLLPLMPAIEPRRATQASGILIALAIGIALWVLLDPMAASVAAYSTDH